MVPHQSSGGVHGIQGALSGGQVFFGEGGFGWSFPGGFLVVFLFFAILRWFSWAEKNKPPSMHLTERLRSMISPQRCPAAGAAPVVPRRWKRWGFGCGSKPNGYLFSRFCFWAFSVPFQSGKDGFANFW